MLRVTPHPAFVSRVRARRGENDFAPALTAKSTDTKKLVEQIEHEIKHGNYQWLRGQTQVKDAIATFVGGELPEPFDLATVALVERAMPRRGDEDASLVGAITAKHGLVRAVETKLEATAISLTYDAARKIVYTPRGEKPDELDASCDVLRAMVCRADDASYAAAREVATKWRAQVPATHRILADFLFPSEPEWADADIDEIVRLAKTTSNLEMAAYPLATVTRDLARLGLLLDGNSWSIGRFIHQYACDVVVAMAPEDAVRACSMLLERAGKGAGKNELAVLGIAMCAIEGEEMATVLGGMLLHAPIGPMAVDYFRRFPALALSALPKVASGSSKAADAARSLLARSAPKDDVPLAPTPKLLAETPWRKKKSKTKVLTIDEASLPPQTTTIAWAEGEREASKLPQNNWYGRDATDITADALAEWEALKPDRRPADIFMKWGTTRGTFRVPDARSLREWNENPAAMTYLGPLRMLAVHGEAALPGLFARNVFGTEWTAEALFGVYLHAIGPETAKVVAEAVARRKSWRKRAQEWIAEHPRVVARALLPAALGEDGKARKDAERAVRIAARSDREAVLGAAAELGADAEHEARELVDRDPLTDLEVKGKLPPFLHVEDLPIVKTKDGKRLSDDAVLALLEILRSTSVDAPYAGLEPLREELDDASLGELAWALVQAWILAGSKGTFEWIPNSLALIGDDSCARRLGPYVREWARKDAKKAKLISDVLAAMGTSSALLHLSHVADKSRFEEAKKHARETLEHVAGHLGLTIDELADRTVPDLDLDPGGTTHLDYGPRKVTVTFDEGLRPVLKGEDGARLPSLPRGTKTDDAALVKLASARFKGLKADAEMVAQTLLRRFESAMVKRRTWKADAFRTYVLEHPLVTHLARRLVWSSGKLFRIAEDGSLADQEDVEYKLSDDAVVSLPHPLALEPAAVTTWSRIFGDYAVVQPFEQLARTTYAPTDAERSTGKLTRFEGRTSRSGPLMGSLDARGWIKWSDETSLSSAGKLIRTKAGADVHITIGFTPGIDFGDVAHSPDQTLRAPSLAGAENFDVIDPIDFSELVRDLEMMFR